jgi:hypothetical protein
MMDDPKESMMSNGTTISPQMQTLMALDSKSRELNELASALSHKMNGGPGDTTIQLRLRDIFAETTDISARRAAIIGGGQFTAPTAADVQVLQDAITAAHTAIINSADVNTLLKLGTTLLSAYGSGKSL